MARSVLRLCAAALVLLWVQGAAYAADAPVIVTLFGKIGVSNRAARDDFHDALLALQNREFDKAFEIDRETLAGLPQHRIAADAEKWPAPVTLEGPRLKDVLALAKASGGTLVVTAIDGYAAELSADDQAGHEWVLAFKSNGKWLDLGGRGPLWLAHDTAGKKATAEKEAKWVYSIFAIEIM